MHLLFADEWLSISLIKTVGWTLIHSLWQGLIAAIIALLILLLTKKSSPLLRYNLLLFLFILFIITVTATFSDQFINVEIGKPSKAISAASFSSQSSENRPFNIIEQTKNYFSDFENFFNTQAAFIVAIWFLIFCVQCLRLCSSLEYIYRIRHDKTYIPSPNWLEICEQLKDDLGIKKTVSLLESATVKMPVVVGFFKPLILLPVGLLANLPYKHLESILLHELAHIRRRDYIVNLLQSFVETVFFFNPALLWLSSLIKEEREACCDEIAVKYLDSKSDYIRALVSFQEYAINSSGYAMAFPGKRNSLLQRVKRIINNENKKLSYMEKAILFCGFIAITTVGALYTKEAKSQNEVLNPLTKPVDKNVAAIPKQNALQLSEKVMNVDKNGYLHSRVSTNNDGKTKLGVEATDLTRRVIETKVVDDVIQELSIKAQKEIEFTLAIQSQQQINDTAQITFKDSGDENSDQQVEDILEVLKKNHIIKGQEGTTFKLTDRELLVNGVKQSAALHMGLKQKYIYKPGDFYKFSASSATTGITVINREN